MFENKFFLLFINFLWMAGLFGALFALVYMAQYRRRQWWSIGYTVNVPRLLAPLYGSLLIFAVGLGLHAYAARQTVSLWVALVWGLLAIFFLFRVVDVIFAALQSGWDTVITPPQAEDEEEDEGPGLPIWSVSVSVLLLANLVLLGWWGSVRLNAGTLTLPWAEQGRAPTASAAIPTQPRSLAKPMDQTQPLTQTNNFTPTLNLAATLTVTLLPAVSTLAPDELQVTPTPATTAENSVALPVVNTLAPDVLKGPSTPAPPQANAANPGVTVTVQVATTTQPLSLTQKTPAPPTPIAQATPTPTAGPSLTLQATIDANVRSTPNMAGTVVGILRNGATALVLGRAANSQWFWIQLSDGKQGWIAQTVVKVNGALTEIPVVKASTKP